MGNSKYPKSGVYSIYCIETKKRYIGAGVDIRRRWGQHKQRLNTNSHWNPLLQEDWNKYGKTSFIFSEVDFCIREKLKEKELEWTLFYKSIQEEFGYNIVLPGGKELEEEGSNRRNFCGKYSKRKPVPGREIIVININTKEAKEYTSSWSAAKELGIRASRISDILRYWNLQKNIYKGVRSVHGYIFVYKNIYSPEFDYTSYSHPVKKGKEKYINIVSK